jgi:hypothetical protein
MYSESFWETKKSKPPIACPIGRQKNLVNDLKFHSGLLINLVFLLHLFPDFRRLTDRGNQEN